MKVAIILILFVLLLIAIYTIYRLWKFYAESQDALKILQKEHSELQQHYNRLSNVDMTNHHAALQLEQARRQLQAYQNAYIVYYQHAMNVDMLQRATYSVLTNAGLYGDSTNVTKLVQMVYGNLPLPPNLNWLQLPGGHVACWLGPRLDPPASLKAVIQSYDNEGIFYAQNSY